MFYCIAYALNILIKDPLFKSEKRIPGKMHKISNNFLGVSAFLIQTISNW
jgi:hypothetical protein